MERVVDLTGAVNFRDFGGYAAADGATVRRGLLFRCGQLASLSQEALAQFAELGIDVICDLRRPDEREVDPTPVPHHVSRRVEIPMDPGSATQLRDSLRAGYVDVSQRVDFMRTITRELARDHVEGYSSMFAALLEHAPGGFLVHCTAGKDRTGVGVALILLALGVPRETVIHDYMLTNEVMDFEAFILPRIRQNLGHDNIDVEGARVLSGVREEYIVAALDEMESACGSLEAYLERAIGLTRRDVDALRTHYLT
jgi:protein-tyrosine phosphatase